MYLSLPRATAAALLAGVAISAQGMDFSIDPRPDSVAGANETGLRVGGFPPIISYGTWVGGYKASLSGAGAFGSPSFMTFSVELRGIPLAGAGPAEFATYSLVMPADYAGTGMVNTWGPNAVAIGDRLGQLLTYAMPLPTATNDANATALQLAIWNVILDTDNSLSTGAFRATGLYNDLANAPYNAQAEAYLVDSLGTTSTLQVGIMSSTQWQDFIVYGPVPEPGTYALMAAGLAAIGFVANRRSRRR